MSINSTLKKYKYFVDLPENDKAIILNIGISLLYFSFFCAAYISEYFPFTYKFTNSDIIYLSEKIYFLCIVFMNVLLLFILYMRRTNPSSTLPSNIQIYFIGQPLMLFAVFNGITELITGLLLGVLPFVGLILFNRRHVFYATIMMWVEIIFLAFGVSLGILPNAPLYIDQVKPEHVPILFSLTQIFMSTPTAIAAALLSYALMQGMALREKTILELSRRDALTGLWNRRYLNEILEREIETAYRQTYPLSVIMMDLDFFKKINDTFGHHAGDEVLGVTAKVLLECVRSTDYVGRFGGEEFLIVLPYCDSARALEVSERCRIMLTIQEIRIGNNMIPITGSFGLTTLSLTHQNADKEHISLDKLVNTADKALYEAKAAGRNCVKSKVIN